MAAFTLARASQAVALVKTDAVRESTFSCISNCRASVSSGRSSIRRPLACHSRSLRSCVKLLGRPLLHQQSAVKRTGQRQQPACPQAALDTVLAFISAELPEGIETIVHYNDYHIAEPAIKTFYLIFTCMFCWGACVFGSMNETFYDSDEYRDAGGNGTQFFRYQMEEEAEQENREELWAEDLRKEIEGRGLDVKELGGAKEEEEKEKELA